MTASSAPAGRARSKAVATWLALVGGSIGLHRFYLHGWRDAWGWALWPASLVGLLGVVRMRALGTDDAVATLLVPWRTCQP